MVSAGSNSSSSSSSSSSAQAALLAAEHGDSEEDEANEDIADESAAAASDEKKGKPPCQQKRIPANQKKSLANTKSALNKTLRKKSLVLAGRTGIQTVIVQLDPGSTNIADVFTAGVGSLTSLFFSPEFRKLLASIKPRLDSSGVDVQQTVIKGRVEDLRAYAHSLLKQLAETGLVRLRLFMLLLIRLCCSSDTKTRISDGMAPNRTTGQVRPPN